MAAAVAAAAEAGEATTETARKLADKRRPNKENAREKQRREMENAREKQRREMEEDALLQDRIREVEEEKLQQRIEAHQSSSSGQALFQQTLTPLPPVPSGCVKGEGSAGGGQGGGSARGGRAARHDQAHQGGRLVAAAAAAA